jgi:predicted acyl esterase
MRFYDRLLKGVEPTVEDPPVAVQTNDGKWRGEPVWPPADAADYTTALRAGEYDDRGTSFSTGSDETATSGVWTISKPLPHDVHLAGSGKVTVDVETAFPNANLAVDVYDLDAEGSGPLITRQGHLIPESGKYDLTFWAADWKIPAGHRIGVRVTETNLDWWLLTLGTQQPVTVKGGAVTLPFLTYKRTETIQGDPGTQLEGYLSETVTVPPETMRESVSPGFNLPPEQTP